MIVVISLESSRVAKKSDKTSGIKAGRLFTSVEEGDQSRRIKRKERPRKRCTQRYAEWRLSGWKSYAPAKRVEN